MFDQFHPTRVIPLDSFLINTPFDPILESHTKVELAKLLIYDRWYVGGRIYNKHKDHKSITHLLHVGNAETDVVVNRMLDVLHEDYKWLIKTYGYEAK